jgi:aminopeptidase N
MQEIKLSDYKRPFYWTRSIDLDFDLYEDMARVESVISIERNTEYTERYPLELDGVDLKILSIQIDNEEITDYTYKNNKLILNPKTDQFVLKTIVENLPQENFTLDGLYKSGSIFCTQCEAEGFRRITFYQDRPDVMAKFTTKISADKKLYPTLLSNGNKVDEGSLSDGRHFTKWEDPFKKPAYLFALVAGDLAKVVDTFTTKSGRVVDLEIFVDHGNEDKTDHAMVSLKNSMKWDEDVYGLEYDLDIFMVVAVNSFNMGAMENKGLNIFNSALVLAKKETATDQDFQAIEAVIGHEYFHNWTGNRVTCRDWFQLTLKEGLTVFRDQEFSSDMLSRPVKRIEDVSLLRAHQYPEDAGPMSHPIKPKSYIEINNFYTATVYEKGAEIIRMIHTLIGPVSFRKGMDLYFERHDGEAVTTEDFISAMSTASGVDLEHFKVWYDQNRTPVLEINTSFDKVNQEFTFNIKQKVITNNSKYDCLHMPFHYSLYDIDGKLLHSEKIELSKLEQTFIVKNIESNPIASWNTNFTAPVIIKTDVSTKDLVTRMSFDQDAFNQYDAASTLYFKEIFSLMDDLKYSRELSLSPDFIRGFGSLLASDNLEDAFLAFALRLPSESVVNQKLEIYDYENVRKALTFVKSSLSAQFYDEFIRLYRELSSQEFNLDSGSMGKRSLKKVCLSYIATSKNDEVFNIIDQDYKLSNNMNDEISLLQAVVNNYPDKRESFVNSFYEKWRDNTLVMQKWLMTLASAPYNTLEDITKLENDPIYDAKVPNLVRSVQRGFIGANPTLFNSIDGSGYKYLASKILMTDKFNPSLASRMASNLNHGAKLDKERQSLLKNELKSLMESKLSKDTYEIVSKAISSF